MLCKFTGDETFEEVKLKLLPKVFVLSDYFEFIYKIPHMRSFLLLHECEKARYFIVTFGMSFDCFKKFYTSNYVDLEQEEILDVLEGKCALGEHAIKNRYGKKQDVLDSSKAVKQQNGLVGSETMADKVVLQKS